MDTLAVAWTVPAQSGPCERLRPSGPPTLTNDFVRAYTFDGLGRLVRTQRQALDDFGDPTIHSTRFYYDGVRRIQEVTGDGIEPAAQFLANGGGGGDPQLESLAETIAFETEVASSGTPLDTTTAPAALESKQMALAAAAGGGFPPPPGDEGPSREYVWGPGDNGLDELLVQFDETRTALYILQDAGGDIVAAAQRDPFEFWTTVASQYTYDAYGCVQTAEVFAPHAPLHAGHKGLFFDSLDDNAPFDPAAGEAPSLIPFTQHLYHVRNRSYCPQLGRWMQRDPNATGMTVVEASNFHGGAIGAIEATFAPDQTLADGSNLYQYLGSSAWGRSDALGLFFATMIEWSHDDVPMHISRGDPFEMVDEYIAEDAGAKLAFLQPIYDTYESFLRDAWTLIQLYPPVGMAVSAYNIASGSTSPLDFLGLIPGGRLARMFGLAGRAHAAVSAAYAVAGRAGRTGKAFVAGMQRIETWLSQGPKEYVVYIAYRAGQPVYVGVTKQRLNDRLRQHNRFPNDRQFDSPLKPIPLPRKLTRREAFAVETLLIVANPFLENKNRSIGNANPMQGPAMQWASLFLKRLGVNINVR